MRDALETTITRCRRNNAAEVHGKRIVVNTAILDTPVVLSDAVDLCEVETNLILDASEAMPHGHRLCMEIGVRIGWMTLTIGATRTGTSDRGWPCTAYIRIHREKLSIRMRSALFCLMR